MSEPASYIRIPASLKDQVFALVPRSIDDDEFGAHQIEFIRQVFGYGGYLRENARDTPLSDAFLVAFVAMFEAVDANSPEDARRCVVRLKEIFGVVFPDIVAGSVDGKFDGK